MDRTPSSSNALAVPSKPVLSLNKQVVLDEDEYTEGLSAIIARDFFPSLVHLDATNNYLSALESKDSFLINASVRRMADLANVPTPTPRSRSGGRTPYVNFPSDTPLRTPRTRMDQPPAKRLKYDPSLSLNAFQARYTSEDNASFTEILDDENKKRKEKYAWAWNAEDRASARRRKEIEGRERMMIEAASSLASDTTKSITFDNLQAITQASQEHGVPVEDDQASNDSEAEVVQELAMLNPDDLPAESETSGQIVLKKPNEEGLVDVMAPLKDTRPAGVHGWRFKTRNALMFAPDADESPYHAPKSTPLAALRGGVRQDPPIIVHANTRLPEQSEGVDGSLTPDAPPSPTRSRVAAAISGTPYLSRSKSPKIGGFGFVDAIPSPSPSQLGPQGVKELMTLGTLLATPRIISGGSDDPADAVASPFVIRPPNARDSLGRRLGNEAGRALTKKAGLLGGATPRSQPSSSSKKSRDATKLTGTTPKRVDILTPAARRLLDRTKAGPATGSPLASAGRRGGGLLGGLTPHGDGGRRAGKQLDLRKVGWGDSPRGTR